MVFYNPSSIHLSSVVPDFKFWMRKKSLEDTKRNQDLIDLQAMKDGSYRYIMHYVEYSDKMPFLVALEKQGSVRSFP